MAFWDKLFGRGAKLAVARRAEARGDLAQAAVLWAEAGSAIDAARVMTMRGDAETEPRQRLAFYVQAASTAPAGSDLNRAARLKRAALVVAMAEGRDASRTNAVSGAVRFGLLEVARDLEELGEHARAADAYAAAGDTEGQARALAQSGDVEGLEDLLASQEVKDRDSRRRHGVSAELDLLVSTGRRRDAIAMAAAFVEAHAGDAAMRERLRSLEARRVQGPLARVALEGHAGVITLALGDEVTIGRTEGTLRVASTAVSRKHVVIARRGDAFVVRDLGSRNRMQLRGMDVEGDVVVGQGIELRLGREVPLKLAPSALLDDALDVELAGQRFVAPLGRASLARVVGRPWHLELASDGWVELVAAADAPPLADGVTLVPRATLLAGDAFAIARGAPVVLRVLGSDAP